MRIGHPSEGTLRAYGDRELGPIAALRCAIHLWRCAPCRLSLEEQRRLARRASELIARAESRVDVEEAWDRFAAVRGGGAERRVPRSVIWAAASAATVLAALLLAPRHHPRVIESSAGDGRRDVCCWDLDGGGPGDDGVMTRSRAGEAVECVVLYDDVDRSRSLTRGDVIRYVSHPGACGLPTTGLPREVDGTLLALLASR